MSADTLVNQLKNLQAQEDHYTGMKLVSFILVLILAIIAFVKNNALNTIRKSTESPTFTYQKIAFYSLIAILIVHTLSHSIF